MMAIKVVILAGGRGTRMRSSTPKVLHMLGDKPLLQHVLDKAEQITQHEKPIVVYGYQGEQLKSALSHYDCEWVEQSQQLGTAHAVAQALPYLHDTDRVLILSADVPLMSPASLKQLIDSTPSNGIGMITTSHPNPQGYGRILRDGNTILGIVEERDATDAQREIKEVNAGIYLVPAKILKAWLPTINNKNKQQEYYLTEIIALAVKNKIAIHALQIGNFEEILGINDMLQLAAAERFYQRLQVDQLMLAGVIFKDPARVDIRGEVIAGKDVCIDVNVIFEGRVVLGDGCQIGANSIIRHSILGDRVLVKSHSMLDGAEVASECIIGPFARLRPGSILDQHARVGNFVEIKNSHVGVGTKINHLSYVGDSHLGCHVNVGAGTITCNYDGVNKHKTVIEDYAFIGSCTQLVAPVTIGSRATIGAGSTITRDVPPDQLTLSRVPQRTVADWIRPDKKNDI